MSNRLPHLSQRSPAGQEHAKLDKELSIKIAVNTDAHSIREPDFIHAGIKQARRAWLEAKDVLNMFTLAKLRRALRR